MDLKNVFTLNKHCDAQPIKRENTVIIKCICVNSEITGDEICSFADTIFLGNPPPSISVDTAAVRLHEYTRGADDESTKTLGDYNISCTRDPRFK